MRVTPAVVHSMDLEKHYQSGEKFPFLLIFWEFFLFLIEV